MASPVSDECRACIERLRSVVVNLSNSAKPQRLSKNQVNDELERFSLWVGNIGALHPPDSPLSIESRLREAEDVLSHILELLDNLNEVTHELLQIASGEREGEVAPAVLGEGSGDEDELEVNEEVELLEEIGACITRLFRVSSLIRQAAPTDLFAKALSKSRYRFNDQFDIAHVGEKFSKLATEENQWLRKRLGRAITQRRHYLSYIQDHRDRLDGMLAVNEIPEATALKSQAPVLKQLQTKPLPDSASRPSTYFTKASTLAPGKITPQMLKAEEELDSDNDARSYTTVSRSVDGDLESSTTVRIPKLEELRSGTRKEIECPFCFRMKKFKSERIWRRHVFFDLRSYVCTYPDCDAPLFGDINEWFQHEMQTHRVSYTCRMCKGKNFYTQDKYLDHVRRQHSQLLDDGDDQALLEISRQPVDQIPAQDCPCCVDWVDRLQERAATDGVAINSSDTVLTVIPTNFKRHLASHLEQLALFAIPIGSASGDNADSNVAIDAAESAASQMSDLSTLSSEPAKHSLRSRSEDGMLREDQSSKDVGSIPQAETGDITEIATLAWICINHEYPENLHVKAQRWNQLEERHSVKISFPEASISPFDRDTSAVLIQGTPQNIDDARDSIRWNDIDFVSSKEKHGSGPTRRDISQLAISLVKRKPACRTVLISKRFWLRMSSYARRYGINNVELFNRLRVGNEVLASFLNEGNLLIAALDEVQLQEAETVMLARETSFYDGREGYYLHITVGEHDALEGPLFSNFKDLMREHDVWRSYKYADRAPGLPRRLVLFGDPQNITKVQEGLERHLIPPLGTECINMLTMYYSPGLLTAISQGELLDGMKNCTHGVDWTFIPSNFPTSLMTLRFTGPWRLVQKARYEVVELLKGTDLLDEHSRPEWHMDSPVVMSLDPWRQSSLGPFKPFEATATCDSLKAEATEDAYFQQGDRFRVVQANGLGEFYGEYMYGDVIHSGSISEGTRFGSSGKIYPHQFRFEEWVDEKSHFSPTPAPPEMDLPESTSKINQNTLSDMSLDPDAKDPSARFLRRIPPSEVYAHEDVDELTKAPYRLTFKKGQQITVTHESGHDPGFCTFHGYYLENDRTIKGSFPASAVTIPFQALVRETGHEIREGNVWHCENCGHDGPYVQEHPGCPNCGHMSRWPKNGLSHLEGYYITVTQASPVPGVLWTGHYINKYSKEKELFTFPRERVIRALPVDSGESNANQGEEQQYVPNRPSKSSEFLVVSKVQTIIGHTATLDLEPGLVIIVDQEAEVEADEYWGYHYDNQGIQHYGFFKKNDVVKRVEGPIEDGEWDDGGFICVFVDEKTYAKLEDESVAPLLRSYEAAFGCEISTHGPPSSTPRLRIGGSERFVLISLMLQNSDWAIDLRCQPFTAQAIQDYFPADTLAYVQGLPLRQGDIVNVLNYGPTEAWYFGTILFREDGRLKQGILPVSYVEPYEIVKGPPSPDHLDTTWAKLPFLAQPLAELKVNDNLHVYPEDAIQVNRIEGDALIGNVVSMSGESVSEEFIIHEDKVTLVTSESLAEIDKNINEQESSSSAMKDNPDSPPQEAAPGEKRDTIDQSTRGADNGASAPDSMEQLSRTARNYKLSADVFRQWRRFASEKRQRRLSKQAFPNLSSSPSKAPLNPTQSGLSEGKAHTEVSSTVEPQWISPMHRDTTPISVEVQMRDTLQGSALPVRDRALRDYLEQSRQLGNYDDNKDRLIARQIQDSIEGPQAAGAYLASQSSQAQSQATRREEDDAYESLENKAQNTNIPLFIKGTHVSLYRDSTGSAEMWIPGVFIVADHRPKPFSRDHEYQLIDISTDTPQSKYAGGHWIPEQHLRLRMPLKPGVDVFPLVDFKESTASKEAYCDLKIDQSRLHSSGYYWEHRLVHKDHEHTPFNGGVWIHDGYLSVKDSHGIGTETLVSPSTEVLTLEDKVTVDHDDSAETSEYPDSMPSFLKSDEAVIKTQFAILEQRQRERLIEAFDPDISSDWDIPPARVTLDRNQDVGDLPFEFNRVHLNVDTSYSDYINASHIGLATSDGEEKNFIAVQRDDLQAALYWKMIVNAADEQTDPVIVIQLARADELLETNRPDFIPANPGDSFRLGIPRSRARTGARPAQASERELIQIQCIELLLRSYSVRDIEIKSLDEHASFRPLLRLRHYLFQNWPNFNTLGITDHSHLITFVRHFEALSKGSHVIQCRAGTPQIAVFIALYELLHELDSGNYDSRSIWRSQDGVFNVVDRLRQQRVMMVQRESQYSFLYDVLRQAWIERWNQRR